MSNNSIIEHRANYYYVEFREEFLIICMNCAYKKPGKEGKKSAASPHCKALILAILENWINNKRGKKEDIAIFMTYKQWSDSMYGMFGRTAIIDSLDELIGEGLLSRAPYKMLGNKDTYKYLLNYQELNRRVKQLPERDIHDTHPKMDASTNKPVDPSKNKPDASKNGRATHPKTDAYPSKNGHNIESTQKHNIETQRERLQVVQETSRSSQPDDSSSLPFSQKNNEETKPSEVDYPLFDRLCQERGYAPDFKVPHNEKNDKAIADLRSQNATVEQVEFVFNDVWEDKDSWWHQHRGKPSTVASQFTARVWKMTAPSAKRQTASGLPSWTEDKSMGTVSTPSTQKATEKPNALNYPISYARLKENKPTRPRSLQARLQQAQKDI